MEKRLSLNFWIGLLIAFAIGIAAPRAFSFLPAILGLLFFSASYFKTKNFLWLEKKEIIFFSSVLLLAFISSLWAPDQNFSIERSTKLITVFMPGLLYLAVSREARAPKKSIILGLITIHLLISVFLITEKLSGHQIIEYVLGHSVFEFKLNKSFLIYGLLTLPILFLIEHLDIQKIKKIILKLALIVITLITLSFTESQTAQLSFIAGIIFLYAFPVKYNAAIKSLCVLTIIFCLLFPFLIKPIQSTLPAETLRQGIGLQASVMNRFDVWNFAAESGFNSPIYGNGIEALRFMKSDEPMKYQESDGALHAHNAVLQIWAEFGFIGLLLGCIFLTYIFKEIIKQKNHNTRRLYLSIFMGCFCCSLTGFGIWQGWQLGLFFGMAGLAIATAKISLKNS